MFTLAYEGRCELFSLFSCSIFIKINQIQKLKAYFPNTFFLNSQNIDWFDQNLVNNVQNLGLSHPSWQWTLLGVIMSTVNSGTKLVTKFARKIHLCNGNLIQHRKRIVWNCSNISPFRQVLWSKYGHQLIFTLQMVPSKW